MNIGLRYRSFYSHSDIISLWGASRACRRSRESGKRIVICHDTSLFVEPITIVHLYLHEHSMDDSNFEGEHFTINLYGESVLKVRCSCRIFPEYI